MKNSNNSAKIASSIRRLREDRGYDIENISNLLGLKEKEYHKLERGTRELNLEQLCLLAEICEVRKSQVINYGHADNVDADEKIKLAREELRIATHWLSVIQKRVAEMELKIIKNKQSA